MEFLKWLFNYTINLLSNERGFAVTITKGYTFGASELVTNTKLHNLVDDGTVDMTAPGAIGGTTPSTGAFTTLVSTGGTINGTVGGITPAAGAFTTLSASGLITATGGQIKFPADVNASADANTLDDYEEGTFTPVFTGSASGTANGIGKYTRIGRICYINLIKDNIGTGLSGNVTITGLPFSGIIGDYVPLTTFVNYMTGYYQAFQAAGAAIINIEKYGDGLYDFVFLQGSAIGTYTDIRISGVYGIG